MSELAQVGDVRECCGERYLLVEQQRGSLVRRWYAHAAAREQRPLAACRRCATALLPYSVAEPTRAAGPAAPAMRVRKAQQASAGTS